MEEASADRISFSSKYHADERELSNLGAQELEQPQPNADRKERLRQARLQDAQLDVWIFYPRRRGHD
jgi:hypothetical protein